MDPLQIPVEEFTTQNPVVTQVDTPMADLEQLFSRHKFRHLPVFDNDKVVGIISQRDLNLVKNVGLDHQRVLAKDLMVPNPISVQSTERLDEVAFKMSEKKIGSVLVYGSDDSFIGIFTTTDALNALVEVVRGTDF